MRGRQFRALGIAVLFVWLSSGAHQARATDDTDRAIASYLESRGASEVARVEQRFLFEGQAHAVQVSTRARGCVGFFVVGLGEVRDVDLTLYTVSGLPLDEDVGVSPYAYVRACAEGGEPLVLGVSLYAGRGELSIFRVETAPRELGRFPAAIPVAVVAGGLLEPPQAVGESIDEGSMASLLATEESTLSGLGYIALGPPELLDLRGGGSGLSPLWLEGHCYRVVAHAPGLRGLGVEISAEEGGSRAVSATGRENVTLSYCAQRSGPHSLRALSAIGSGLAVMRIFEHPRAQPDSDATIALAAAEIAHQFERRGFVAHHLGDAWIEARESSRFAAPMSAGECYAAAASGAQPLPLDLRLIDPDGRVVSRTEGRNGVPLVYVCATQTGMHQIMLTSRGSDQRVAVWLGASKPKPGSETP